MEPDLASLLSSNPDMRSARLYGQFILDKIADLITGLNCTELGKRAGPRLRELAPAARESQEAGFTQPRDHSCAQPCTVNCVKKLPICTQNANAACSAGAVSASRASCGIQTIEQKLLNKSSTQSSANGRDEGDEFPPACPCGRVG